jgi:hypothetical protein
MPVVGPTGYAGGNGDAAPFSDVVTYVQLYRHGSTGALNLLINLIAKAKGVPARVGNAEAEAFFCCTAAEGTSRVQPSAAGDRHPPNTIPAGFRDQWE